MDWKEAELSKIMFIGEKLIWGLKTKIETPKMRTHGYWYDEYVFFTDRRILILWDIRKNTLLEIPYDAINTIDPEGAPGSGGVAGVKCQAKGGAVVGIGSPYAGNVRIQFPDAESLKYGQWLLNEASKGGQLAPGAETPTIQGQVDPNATPQPPKQKSGCFVATATYGSSMAEEVITLQNFRDRVLRQHYFGRIMIEIYYMVSPQIAEFVSRSPVSKGVSRFLLAPTIYLAKGLSGKQ